MQCNAIQCAIFKTLGGGRRNQHEKMMLAAGLKTVATTKIVDNIVHNPPALP